MRNIVIALSAAALLLAAAGCGGSSSNSEDDAAATIETSDTNAVDTTGDTDTTGMDTGGVDTTSTGDVSLEGCTKLTDLSVKFSEALGAASTGSGAPDLDATAKAYEDFADEVPAEIRGAFRIIAGAFSTYADVLGDVDLSAGKTPSPETLQKLAEAAQTLDNTKLTAASAEIEAWAKENCNAGG